MAGLIAEILPYTAAAVVGIGALVVAYFKGKGAQQSEQQVSERKALDKAREVEREIDSESDSAIRDRAGVWLRHDKR